MRTSASHARCCGSTPSTAAACQTSDRGAPAGCVERDTQSCPDSALATTLWPSACSRTCCVNGVCVMPHVSATDHVARRHNSAHHATATQGLATAATVLTRGLIDEPSAAPCTSLALIYTHVQGKRRPELVQPRGFSDGPSLRVLCWTRDPDPYLDTNLNLNPPASGRPGAATPSPGARRPRRPPAFRWPSPAPPRTRRLRCTDLRTLHRLFMM